jgi:hypothetical protein
MAEFLNSLVYSGVPWGLVSCACALVTIFLAGSRR